jgi:hypothetical protein
MIVGVRESDVSAVQPRRSAAAPPPPWPIASDIQKRHADASRGEKRWPIR